MRSTLIFGPPGTGKTTELMRRIEVAVKSGVDPASIHFLSFTRAAAQEVLGRLGLKKSKNFSTIHSLCYSLGGVNKSAVMSPRKLEELSSITGVPTASDGWTDELTDGERYLQIIGKAVNTFQSYESTYDSSDKPGTYDEFMMFATTYDNWRAAYGYVDFNDMLKRVLDKDIKFKTEWLVIDEGQDLTPLQWAVINKLITVGTPRNILVAGDDDQCLYSWGGALVHGMDDFGFKHGSEVEVLSKSWRIPRSVHELADSVIKRVSRRVGKKYDPRNASGTVLYYPEFSALGIGHDEDVMIIARTHSLLEPVEEELRGLCIPYAKTNGTSLYTNRFAMSIRGVMKAKRGELIKDEEYRALLSTINDAGVLASVERGEFSVLASVEWKDILDIPLKYMDYYESVNMEHEPSVILSTIHAVKGKEANRVILLTDQTPRVGESMNTLEGADEEHRCMYVGITRAKDQLDIITNDEGYIV